ncbi:hypothetical protein ACI1US_00687 [Leucobacter sp. BZR 635]
MSNTQDFTPINPHTNTRPAAETGAHEIPATPLEPARRPDSIRHWSRVIDALIAREIDAQFAAAGASRRDLRVLNLLSGERELSDRMRERIERRGGRMWSLADRGWIQRASAETMRATGLSWELTDAGVAARERLNGIVETVRERTTSAVSPGDLATTLATLEAVATEFGWAEGMRLPRGHRGRGRGYARGFGHGHGFARGDGHGHGHGFGDGHGHQRRGEGQWRGHGSQDHGCGRDHAHGGTPWAGQRSRARRGDAFERGYVAGRAARNHA